MKPKKPESWDSNYNTNQADENLVVVTISLKWDKLARSDEKDEKNPTNKILLFQEDIKKIWKGLDLSLSILPATGSLISKNNQFNFQNDDPVK